MSPNNYIFNHFNLATTIHMLEARAIKSKLQILKVRWSWKLWACLFKCFQELLSILENKKHQKLVWLRESFLFLLFPVFSKWHCLENNKMLFSPFFYCLQNKIKQQKTHLFSVFFFFPFSSLLQHSRDISSSKKRRKFPHMLKLFLTDLVK